MALVLEALNFIPRHHIKFFRTDAIFLQTPIAVAKKAKRALLQATRETLHCPSSWLTFNGPSLVQGTSGEGQMFRVFNCQLPVEQQKSILFDQRTRTPPHLLPAVQVFREGETAIEVLALKLTREKRSFLLYGPPGVGKSHLMRRCLEQLDLVTCAARTHVASRQFEAGETLSRLSMITNTESWRFGGTSIFSRMLLRILRSLRKMRNSASVSPISRQALIRSSRISASAVTPV